MTASSDSRNTIPARDAQLIRQLIADTRPMKSIGERMKYVSGRLLGLPYIANPLIGSPNVPEELVTRMDAFDCTTYLQTVLALALAKSTDEFVTRLREIRYVDGEVDYYKRLHYTMDWAQYQVRRGLLVDLTLGEEIIVREKTLSFLKGIEPRRVTMRYFAKTALGYVSRWLVDGDLIYFISSRRDLDTFHVGMIFRNGSQVVMRHARHKRERVLEQSLDEFFQRSQFSGFIINRPKDS